MLLRDVSLGVFLLEREEKMRKHNNKPLNSFDINGTIIFMIMLLLIIVAITK